MVSCLDIEPRGFYVCMYNGTTFPRNGLGLMATLNNVKERLAATLGISVSVIERELRALREAGWTPAGRPGGGVGAAHYGDLALVYVILGLAAGRHSDAPEAVQKLRQLPCRGVQNAPSIAEALPTINDEIAEPMLAEQLVSWITALATQYQKRMRWTVDIVEKARTWEIQLCVNPAHAIIKYGPENRTIYLYAADEQLKPVLRRFAVFTGEILLAAADLLVDTQSHETTLNAVMFLDATKPAKADQEQENAGLPRQREPA